MGRKADLEALQRVQNIAMLWIGGEGRRAFRINKSLDRLGWLDIGQIAAKASILAELKVTDYKQGGTFENPCLLFTLDWESGLSCQEPIDGCVQCCYWFGVYVPVRVSVCACMVCGTIDLS